MPARERMQRTSFRLADAVCAVIAFLGAYRTLLPARNLLDRVLPAFFGASGHLIPAATREQIPAWPEVSWIVLVAALAMMLVLEYGHDSRPVRIRTYGNILFLQIAATSVAAGVIATVVYTFRAPLYSRLFVVSYLACLFLLTAGYRLITKALTQWSDRSRGATRRVVIAGRADGISAFLTMARETGRAHNHVHGCLLTDSAGSAPLDVPVLGNVSALGDLLIHEPIDEVVMVLPNDDAPWLVTALQHCDYFRISVHLIHESLLRVELRDLKAFSGMHPVPSILLLPEEELSSARLIFKRLLDVILSLSALIVLFPIMLLIAVAIKITTPHLPIFYRWHVVGYLGRRFTGYKFTTMMADADERKGSLGALNEMSGPVFKIRNDPRVVPLGRFLRKYSLNELPQFWSVLVGDMSLVGPRPAGPHELAGYAQWHKRKLSVWPGITCFWQVRGRNVISNFDDWVKMDLEYIQKRSVRTDMTILAQTVSVVVRGTGS